MRTPFPRNLTLLFVWFLTLCLGNKLVTNQVSTLEALPLDTAARVDSSTNFLPSHLCYSNTRTKLPFSC